jgi:hypothetical protein
LALPGAVSLHSLNTPQSPIIPAPRNDGVYYLLLSKCTQGYGVTEEPLDLWLNPFCGQKSDSEKCAISYTFCAPNDMSLTPVAVKMSR